MTASRMDEGGVYIALGANLPSRMGSPRETLEAALTMIERAGVRVLERSPWYESEPVPPSDQPWFVNGVAEVVTELNAADLLALLHTIEDDVGRVRRERWEARVLDLDLIDFRGECADGGPILPHPRMAERSFVLRPLHDIAPDWRHPATGETIRMLIDRLPPDAGIVRTMAETA